jgi:hypothetical protein
VAPNNKSIIEGKTMFDWLFNLSRMHKTLKDIDWVKKTTESKFNQPLEQIIISPVDRQDSPVVIYKEDNLDWDFCLESSTKANVNYRIRT